VAPVVVGDGTYVAAGSTIDKDVPSGSLGVARGHQRNIAGWVQRRRAGTRTAQVAAAVAALREAALAAAASEPSGSADGAAGHPATPGGADT
jgi:bifunctional UDP-N-acetylglucosamine pyrophosphorylase / glucosamine-1-phosphate N-acetyltransferase